MKMDEKKYTEQRIESTKLEIPRNTYQRELNTDRVHRIAKQFDERVANEPKVSFRDGRYYVFDGQHTIAARVERNGGKPLMILCKVYHGLTEKEEALLFAQQTGFSADLGAGARIRALVFAEDPIACSFIKATENAGARIDFSQKRGKGRLACVSTAFKEYQKIGSESYMDSIRILLEAWNGDPDSLRAEAVAGMCGFVDLYKGEFDRKRLVRRCRKCDPITIYRKGFAMGNNMAGNKKYLYQVLDIYNGTSQKLNLPMKI
ncbi:MAG: type II toxin-antitoxin system PemK/MazF family toxin [Oscillospiraceae bacterium]|nr:type II toxin-antitoxin system PemK/MazF family toxin [Oscillospiraceae bacterium]